MFASRTSTSLLALLLILLPVVYSLTGTVFRDYNFNGVHEAREQGVRSLSVSFELRDKATQFATTDDLGSFSFTYNPAVDGSYKLTVSGIPSYLKEGRVITGVSQSTVHFGNETVVSIPLTNMRDFCSNSYLPNSTIIDITTLAPRPVYRYKGRSLGGAFGMDVQVAAVCYVGGDVSSTTIDPVIVSFPLAAGDIPPNYALGVSASTTIRTVKTAVGQARQVGSVWGLTYERRSKTLFAGAFEKRYSGYPDGDNTKTGLIYAIPQTTPATAPYTFLDLDSLGFSTRTQTPHSSPIIQGNCSATPCDVPAWDAVGKTAIGGLTLSDSGEILYVANINLKQILAIPISNPPTPPTSSASITVINVPPPVGCPASDTVVFGLNYRDDRLWIGVTCTGESTQNVNELKAYIVTMDVHTRAFTTVLTIPLSYSRGTAATIGANPNCDASSFLQTPAIPNLANWRPWAPIPTSNPLENNECFYPQPIVSDIEFGDSTDQLIIGIMDRYGHQIGSFRTNLGPVEGVTSGDILCATRSGTSEAFVLENNAVCGNRLGGVDWKSKLRIGVNNNQGPGNGEFFTSEYFAAGTNLHSEVALGGLTSIIGSGAVMASVFDPLGSAGSDAFRSGGLHFYSTDNGTVLQWLELFDFNASLSFGKAAGVGDIVVMCGNAPSSVATRLFVDGNSNGIQDAGEPGIPGITINLYSQPQTSTGGSVAGVVIATGVTDVNGYVSFYNTSAAPGTDVSFVVNGSDVLNNFIGVSPFQAGNPRYDSDAVVAGTGAFVYANILIGALPGSVDNTVSLGVAPPTISGTAFVDSTIDGVYDGASEAFLPTGTIVEIYNQAGNLVATTTVDPFGHYSANVPTNGVYTVRVPLSGANALLFNPNGYVPTFRAPSTPLEPITNGALPETFNGLPYASLPPVTIGFQSVQEQNFGLRNKLYLGQWAFVDENRNGIHESSESGYPNITVTLCVATTPLCVTTKTSATGQYKFEVQPDTNYTISIDFADFPNIGWSATSLRVGTDPSVDNDAENSFPQKRAVTVFPTPSQAVVSVNVARVSILNSDFGLLPPLSITTVLFSDLNGNGVQDASEPRLPGLVLTLANGTSTAPLANDTTDANGVSVFVGVPGNTLYSLKLDPAFNNGVLSADFPLGFDISPTTAVASMYNGVPVFSRDVAIGTTSANAIIGLIPRVPIGQSIWYDANANGLFDSNETGIAGVVVSLYNPATNQTMTTLTSSTGAYSFAVSQNTPYSIFVDTVTNNAALSVGVPKVATFVNRPGGIFSVGTPVTNLPSGNAGVISTSVTATYPSKLDQNFGFRPRVDFSGSVFNDGNGNGNADDGVAGITGVTVAIYVPDPANPGSFIFVKSVPTDANGNYLITDLLPFTDYRVVVLTNQSQVAPLRISPLSSVSGGNQGVASTINGGAASVISVSSGAGGVTGLNFGFRPPINIVGNVFFDNNTNNQRDSTDSPLTSPLTVTVVTSTGQLITTTVNSSGSFVFSDLPNGVVAVGITLNQSALLGVIPTLNDPNVNPAINSDGVPGTINGQTATVVNFGTLFTSQAVDFGFRPQPPNVNVGHYVWCDVNCNGMKDSFESGIYGIHLELVDASGVVINTTVTNSSGYFNFNVTAGAVYTVRVNLDTQSDILQFPVLPRQGIDNTLNSAGHLSIVNGIRYSAVQFQAPYANITNFNFGFFCVDCNYDTKLYDSWFWSSPLENAKVLTHNRRHNDNDDDDDDSANDDHKSKKQKKCDHVPLHVSASNDAGSACLTFTAAPGVNVGSLNYFALSGSAALSANLKVKRATMLYSDITSSVSLQTYSSGLVTCGGRVGCSSFGTMTGTNFPLVAGDLVVCLGCQQTSFVGVPLQVCFEGLTASDLAMVSVKADLDSVSGYCGGTSNVTTFGVLPVQCCSSQKCSGMEAEVACDAGCGDEAPVSIRTTSPQRDTVCLNIENEGNVHVGHVDFVTFIGSSLPFLNASTRIVSVTSKDNDVTNTALLELFQGGSSVCSSIGCSAFPNALNGAIDVQRGNLNLCFGCGITDPYVYNPHNDWDSVNDGNDSDNDVNDAPVYKLELPLRVCFSRPGLAEVDLVNTVVKVRTSKMKGYCGIGCATTTGVLEPCICKKQLPSFNDDHNDDDSSAWEDESDYEDEDESDYEDNDDYDENDEPLNIVVRVEHRYNNEKKGQNKHKF